MTVSTATTALFHAARNKWAQATLVAAIIFGIYFLASNVSSPYVQLADSLLHGRLYLTPEQAPGYLELARYFDNGTVCNGQEPDCRGYVIDPAAPALLLVPFVAVLGPDFNQVLVSLGYGAVAMGLFWVVTRQLGCILRTTMRASRAFLIEATATLNMSRPLASQKADVSTSPTFRGT